MSTVINVRSVSNRHAFSWKEWAVLLLSLGKMRISLLATLTAATGSLLATGEVSIRMFVPAAAVFLLACGACGLNQYQERETDAFMERTRNRPLPSGKLHPSSALLISSGFIFAGTFTLFRGVGFWGGILGLFAIIWYNGIYTYLKRKTAFAAVPGALVGAIPPVLGWVSGGGSLIDPRIWIVALFFFIWQVPHFWLLLLFWEMDYEKGGFPLLTRILTSEQLRRITFMWITATAVTCMMMPVFGIVESLVIKGGIFGAGVWLVLRSFRILTAHDHEFHVGSSFRTINTYVLLIMLLLTLDKLLH